MNKTRMILMSLLILLLCGCSPQPAVQFLGFTLTPSYQPIDIPSNTPTRASTSTVTPIPIDFLEIDALVPGVYLVYFSGNPNDSRSPDDIFLSVARPDGEYVGVLAQVRTTNVSISPDLKWITELPEIMETATGKVTVFEELKDCWEPPSWAPDSQRFVVSCVRGEGENLYVFSLEDNSMLQITDFGKDFSGRMPSWSPDGKWIAYFKGHTRSGTSEQGGLHIINVECFSSPETCADAKIGLAVGFPYVWSPDSQYLASIGFDEIASVNSIDVFSFTNGDLSLYKKYPVAESFDWMSWAPSQLIAVDVIGATLLLSTDTGVYTEIDINDLPFSFWIERQ